MLKPSIIAVIPARGGSKRLPGKNIVKFMDKPLIAWTIEAARQIERIAHVLVSTEDENIASVSRLYGAEVPFLRDNYFDDFSNADSATIATVDKFQKLTKKKFDIVIQLMANCPLRTAANINDAIDNFLVRKNNFQISCFRYGWMNPWWAFRINQENKPERIFDMDIFKRSQDLDPLYCPTGAIWIANTEKLKENGNFYGTGFELFPMDWKSAVDIDDMDDFLMAEALYHMNKNDSCR